METALDAEADAEVAVAVERRVDGTVNDPVGLTMLPLPGAPVLATDLVVDVMVLFELLFEVTVAEAEAVAFLVAEADAPELYVGVTLPIIVLMTPV